MKFKRLALCLLFCSLLLVGCNKPKSDEVESISVDPSFIMSTFYVGQTIDLSDYSLTLIYSSKLTQTIALNDPSITITGLETETPGTKNVKISYGKISVIIKVDVVVPAAINGTYKGETLQFYYNEQPNLSEIFISILYESGDEENVSLSNSTVQNLDVSSVTSEPRQLKVIYKSIVVQIPYTVSYREIEPNKVYGYVQAGETRELYAEVLFQDENFILFVYSITSSGDKHEVNKVSITRQADGTYLSSWVLNSQRCYFRIVVSGNNIEASPAD